MARAQMKARAKTRPTGGYFDPALCIDFEEVARRQKADRMHASDQKAARRTARSKAAKVDPMIAAQAEVAMHASLKAAWEDAALGSDKREALGQLRAFEIRTGRYVVEDRAVEVSLGASSWQEVK